MGSITKEEGKRRGADGSREQEDLRKENDREKRASRVEGKQKQEKRG